MENISDPYEDKWSDTPIDELMRERPLGVTILAVLQIIGSIILIIILIVQPMFFDDSINDFFGIPLTLFLILYVLILIPLSLYLAYGLLTGKEWARFATSLFQLSSAITATIRFNFFGVLIPIYIVYYLHKTHVKDFFRTDKGLRNDIKLLIIGGIAILLIFNGYIALLSNPLVMSNFQSNTGSSIREEQLIGTWINTNGDYTIQFDSDYFCMATKDGENYEGTWEINKYLYHVELNWSTAFKLVHPNDEDSYYEIEQIHFIGDTISLYTPFEAPSYYICNKV